MVVCSARCSNGKVRWKMDLFLMRFNAKSMLD